MLPPTPVSLSVLQCMLPLQSGVDWLSGVLQERNLKHPNGGPEASRISAAARRNLANLGTSLDHLADLLEFPQCATV